MKILKILLGGLLGLLVLLGAIGFFLPDSAHVERSIEIKAPQAKVFAMLSSFQRFNEWSPWYELEPTAQVTYSGPSVGVGAKMAWAGKDVGSGSQTITGIDGAELIRIDLDFGPDGKAKAYYQLSPVDDTTTRLVWGFDTTAEGNLLARGMARYFNLMMESMLGPDYEKGLAKLKTVLEQPTP